MKSNTAIHVTLWDNQVGTLFWSEKESLSYFEFAPLFLGKNLDISPIIHGLPKLREQKSSSFPKRSWPFIPPPTAMRVICLL